MNLEDHIEPSRYGRRDCEEWCNVTVCTNCGLTGYYYDAHPVNPCVRCGHKDKKEVVGRWSVKPKPWWKFWELEIGIWELKND